LDYGNGIHILTICDDKPADYGPHLASTHFFPTLAFCQKIPGRPILICPAVRTLTTQCFWDVRGRIRGLYLNNSMTNAFFQKEVTGSAYNAYLSFVGQHEGSLYNFIHYSNVLMQEYSILVFFCP
jgi:hypothetical protein